MSQRFQFFLRQVDIRPKAGSVVHSVVPVPYSERNCTRSYKMLWRDLIRGNCLRSCYHASFCHTLVFAYRFYFLFSLPCFAAFPHYITKDSHVRVIVQHVPLAATLSSALAIQFVTHHHFTLGEYISPHTKPYLTCPLLYDNTVKNIRLGSGSPSGGDNTWGSSLPMYQMGTGKRIQKIDSTCGPQLYVQPSLSRSYA